MDILVKLLKTSALTFGALLCGLSQASASGLLTAKGQGTELQIQDHVVNVSIEDGYAITSVENTFYNSSANDLEAVYEFPVPENGTVAEFTVWIDGKNRSIVLNQALVWCEQCKQQKLGWYTCKLPTLKAALAVTSTHLKKAGPTKPNSTFGKPKPK